MPLFLHFSTTSTQLALSATPCDTLRDCPSPKANQVPLEKPESEIEKQIAKIKKLQDRGLTNEEIAELLEIPLEVIESLP